MHARSRLQAPVPRGRRPPPVRAQMLASLKERLKANPHDLAALVGLASLYFDAGKYAQAIPYYQRALALDPSNPDTRTDYATALHGAGHDLEALDQLQTGADRQSGLPAGTVQRGRSSPARSARRSQADRRVQKVSGGRAPRSQSRRRPHGESRIWRSMKLYISADMEGTAAVCSWTQVDPANTTEYPYYRTLMSREVRAAIDGARGRGAGESWSTIRTPRCATSCGTSYPPTCG